VQALRGDIAVQVEGQDSFRVKYVSSDPQTAQRVTSRVASLYIEENLRDRANLATKRTCSRVAAQRREGTGSSSTKRSSKPIAAATPASCRRSSRRTQTIRSGAAELQGVHRFDQSHPGSAAPHRAADRRRAGDAARPGAGRRGRRRTRGERADIDGATTRSGAAQLKAFPAALHADHPDRPRSSVSSDLQARLTRREASRPPAAPVEKPTSPAELARQKRLRDLRTKLEVIDHQLAVNQAEETASTVDRGLPGQVDVVPTRESELVELTRDYKTLDTAYTSFLCQREDSRLAGNLERGRLASQFRILDPASLPGRPYNQANGWAIIASGAIAGLVLGSGVRLAGIP